MKDLGILVWQDFMFGCGQVTALFVIGFLYALLTSVAVPCLRLLPGVCRSRGRTKRQEAETSSISRHLRCAVSDV